MGESTVTTHAPPDADFADRLAAWLGAEVSGVRRPSGNGYSNETLLAHLGDGRDVVVRLAPARVGVFPTYDLGLQYDAMRCAGDGGIPVPPLLASDPDGAVLGRPAYVMEAVPGRVPVDNPPYTMEGWLLDAKDVLQRSVVESAVDVLAAIHRLPRAVWAPLVDRVPVGLDAQIELWVDTLRWAVGDRPQPVVDRALAWLRTERPNVAEGDHTLCWGDARIGNVIFDAEGGAAAVLDWEMACVADPELDLAWFLFLDRHFSSTLGLPDPPGFPTRAAVIARWEAATGRTARHLAFYEVLAGIRFGVVMARIAQLMAEDGVIEAGSSFEWDNTATAALAEVLAEIGVSTKEHH